MARDMSQRVTLARVDDVQRRVRISVARELIYEKNQQVNSAAVEKLLRETSLVPTVVCVRENLCSSRKWLSYSILEFIF
jgi:hypothetical protein